MMPRRRSRACSNCASASSKRFSPARASSKKSDLPKDAVYILSDVTLEGSQKRRTGDLQAGVAGGSRFRAEQDLQDARRAHRQGAAEEKSAMKSIVVVPAGSLDYKILSIRRP
ncbi:MAG: hypothetical protein MZV64_14865 [Ignavibacteriales bacterium]|nr:hypothetical protein [Ignavibacteriales bacterium]